MAFASPSTSRTAVVGTKLDALNEPVASWVEKESCNPFAPFAARSFGFAANNNARAQDMKYSFGVGGPVFDSRSSPFAPVVTPTTVDTPFAAHIEKDVYGYTGHYQSITFQQPYQAFSFEELRLADYSKRPPSACSTASEGVFGRTTPSAALKTTDVPKPANAPVATAGSVKAPFRFPPPTTSIFSQATPVTTPRSTNSPKPDNAPVVTAGSSRAPFGSAFGGTSFPPPATPIAASASLFGQATPVTTSKSTNSPKPDNAPVVTAGSSKASFGSAFGGTSFLPPATLTAASASLFGQVTPLATPTAASASLFGQVTHLATPTADSASMFGQPTLLVTPKSNDSPKPDHAPVVTAERWKGKAPLESNEFVPAVAPIAASASMFGQATPRSTPRSTDGPKAEKAPAVTAGTPKFPPEKKTLPPAATPMAASASSFAQATPLPTAKSTNGPKPDDVPAVTAEKPESYPKKETLPPADTPAAASASTSGQAVPSIASESTDGLRPDDAPAVMAEKPKSSPQEETLPPAATPTATTVNSSPKKETLPSAATPTATTVNPSPQEETLPPAATPIATTVNSSPKKETLPPAATSKAAAVNSSPQPDVAANSAGAPTAEADATKVDELDPVNADWARNYWDREIIRQVTRGPSYLSGHSLTLLSRLLPRSMDTVIISNVKDEDGGASKAAQVVVHRALLQHFSRGYREALAKHPAGGDAGAAVKLQHEVISKMPARVLDMIVAWIYTGQLPSSGKPGRTHMDLIELYIFASDHDMIALRRYTLAEMKSLMVKTVFTAPFQPKLPGMMEVRRAYDALPTTSPLRSWLVEAYVHHYSPARSTHEVKDLSSLPSDFLGEVMHGKARLLDQAEAFNSIFKPSSRKERCRCCHSKCYFHEHESPLEQIAACGSDGTYGKATSHGLLTMPGVRERIFTAKFGSDEEDGSNDEILSGTKLSDLSVAVT